MGLEPTPGPWQGPVLPLYYGRQNQQNFNTPAICRQVPSRGDCQGLAHTHVLHDPAGQASLKSR